MSPAGGGGGVSPQAGGVAVSPAAGGAWPDVTVVMAVRDESAHLDEVVEAVLAQEYPGRLELVIAVAPSTDDTAERAARLTAGSERARVVENPAGLTPTGLNAALAVATGAVVARVDGHAVIPPGYVRRAVELLDETGAENVGGVMRAVGTTPFERAVAAAMSSRFGAGDAKFHTGGSPGPADTVYLGVFRRETLTRLGGFDERFVRAQDAELNHRIRAGGGLIYFHPDLQVRYRPRGSFPALARQFLQYGRWRRVIARRHRRSLRWRQLAPPVALVANVTGLGLGLAGARRWLVLPAGYLLAVTLASAVAGRGLGRSERARLPAVYVTMHTAWAVGFLTSPRRMVPDQAGAARPVDHGPVGAAP